MVLSCRGAAAPSCCRLTSSTRATRARQLAGRLPCGVRMLASRLRSAAKWMTLAQPALLANRTAAVPQLSAVCSRLVSSGASSEHNENSTGSRREVCCALTGDVVCVVRLCRGRRGACSCSSSCCPCKGHVGSGNGCCLCRRCRVSGRHARARKVRSDADICAACCMATGRLNQHNVESLDATADGTHGFVLNSDHALTCNSIINHSY